MVGLLDMSLDEPEASTRQVQSMNEEDEPEARPGRQL